MDINSIAGPSYSGGGVGLTPKNYAGADSRRESEDKYVQFTIVSVPFCIYFLALRSRS